MSESCIKNTAIVLPSLNPDDKFLSVVDGLVNAGFEHIVIVDDGSDEEHQSPFKAVEACKECAVLHHGHNKGKGRALKTAFEYIITNLPDCSGAITIDGDGQHLTEDIIACGNKMLENPGSVVLGCRDFNQPDVPPRSVAGNKSTRRMFKILYGITITDTQTGLRAIPMQYLKDFCSIEGERFEYETNMLLQMHGNKIPFIEQKITTVYDSEDYSSHYNAVKDSARVANVMAKFFFKGSAFKYLASSVLSWVADNGVYFLLTTIAGLKLKVLFQAISTFSSSFLNFNLNKFWVFASKGKYSKDLLKYYAVCVPRTLLSILFANIIQDTIGAGTPILCTIIKILVDLVLFIATYFIQKKWVFNK